MKKKSITENNWKKEKKGYFVINVLKVSAWQRYYNSLNKNDTFGKKDF